MNPTSEQRAAQDWLARAWELKADGFEAGVAVICREHLRPMHDGAMHDGAFGGVKSCGCFLEFSVREIIAFHGLSDIASAFGTIEGMAKRRD